MATMAGGTSGTTGTATPVDIFDTPVTTPTSAPPVEKKPAITIIPHQVVCDADTRCDKCRRLGCSGCVHTEGEQLGLCVVCAGNYKETDVVIHPIPTAEELKTIPPLVMPPAKYKKGERVCIISANEILRDFVAQAKAMGSDAWVAGTTANNLSIGKIITSGLNVERPRKGHVYLVQMEAYPHRQILVAEKGISNEKKYVNFKLMFVGQLVRVKPKFDTPVGYNPNYSSQMQKNAGQVFRIMEKMQDRRCYNLNDGSGGMYSHEWLEQLRPFIKQDRPIKEKHLKMKDTVKRLTFEAWIRQSWRSGGKGPSVSRTEPNPVEGRFDRGKEHLVGLELFQELNVIHKDLINHWGIHSGTSTGQMIPLVFILGEKHGVVSIALPCFNNFQAPGGCGQMPNIKQEEFSALCADLVAQKYTPCGIARLGAFSINNPDGRGSSLKELSRYKGFYILSMGRDGMNIEMSDSGGYPVQYNYRVINRKEVKPTPEVKTEVTPVVQ